MIVAFTAQFADGVVHARNIALLRVVLHEVVEQRNLVFVVAVGFAGQQERDDAHVQQVVEVAHERVERESFGEQLVGILLDIVVVHEGARFELRKHFVQQVDFGRLRLFTVTRLVIDG